VGDRDGVDDRPSRLDDGSLTVTTRSFRIAALAELVTLIVLLANLATVHLKPVTSLVGPTHGCAYLVIVVATWRTERAALTAKLMALLPGIGGLPRAPAADR
jgi:hypothetical protein